MLEEIPQKNDETFSSNSNQKTSQNLPQKSQKTLSLDPDLNFFIPQILSQETKQKLLPEKPQEKTLMEYQAKVKNIHQSYKEDGILFEDKEFPALDSFLFSEEKIDQAKKDL